MTQVGFFKGLSRARRRLRRVYGYYNMTLLNLQYLANRCPVQEDINRV